MRSNRDFIEVTGFRGDKKFLVNKAAIILIKLDDYTDGAVIMTINGDQIYKLPTKESYSELAEELLRNEWDKEMEET